MSTMKDKYVSPYFNGKGFTCSSCSSYSNHDWDESHVNETNGSIARGYSSGDNIKVISVCKCQQCGYISFWYNEKLIWPLNSSVEAPLLDMPEDIKNLYNEARNIIELSPKGSCAILRLALQKLCNKLAGQDENKKIDGAIKKLVEKGLPLTLQKAMDTVRIVGDEAVHPGTINIDDNRELAIAMFRLINIIIEKMIVEPNEINKLYNLMPKNKIVGIENRDKIVS